MMHVRELKLFLPFVGIGVGGHGFLDAEPRVGNLAARWRVIGGVDIIAAACRNAERVLQAPITCMDLMSREQYRAFHGKEPPEGWCEATPADILAAAGGEYPDVVFTSPPCKGYSGLLAESMSKTDKYQALNELALRGVWLSLEAFKDDPPSFFLLENVPRMASRGRRWLDQITQLLHAYGYAVAETTHDCGELGGLAQSRKRFLLVARHIEKVPNYLYQPPCKPLRAVGDVLGRLPVPGTVDLPLHRLPNLQWKTWVRLAFVQAGSDWRSLNRLRIEDGVLADYGLMPARPYHNGAYGVQDWKDHAGTITGNGRPAGGTFSVADPRFDARGNDYCQYGVNQWRDSTGAMINIKSPGQGVFAVQDPRVGQNRPLFNHAYKVVRFDRPSPAVAGPGGAGGMAVADPRPPAGPLFSKYAVTDWKQNSGTVIGGDDQGAYAVADPRPAWENRRNNLHVGAWDTASHTIIGGGKGVQGGWLSVADPRPGIAGRGKGSDYLTGGHYGVVPWTEHSYAVTGSGKHDNGHNNVADPRLPAPAEKLNCVIVAEDNTWHRPFTTMEVAALQSIFDPEEYLDFELTGGSDGEIREWIGNAVPRAAGKALGEVFGHALLLTGSGETFILSSTPVWVRPVIAAMQFGSVS